MATPLGLSTPLPSKPSAPAPWEKRVGNLFSGGRDSASCFPGRIAPPPSAPISPNPRVGSSLSQIAYSRFLPCLEIDSATPARGEVRPGATGGGSSFPFRCRAGERARWTTARPQPFLPGRLAGRCFPRSKPRPENGGQTLRPATYRGREQPGTEVGAVQGMIDHTAHIHSPRSAHNPILSPFPRP
jgi:hypothetical protein